MRPNLYLIGMTGSGKSVTGKKLAGLLKKKFIDLDEEIQTQSGRTIPDIFEKEGEDYFRDFESRILKKLNAGGLVVATGGGVVLRPANIARMRATGKIIYLAASLDDLWKRLMGKKDRPLLKGEDPRANLADILGKRSRLYEEASDFQINTDGLSAEEAARKILEIFELN